MTETHMECRSVICLLLPIAHSRYDAAVTLLVYTTTGYGAEPDGGLFARVCDAIDQRYPLAFSLIATRRSTGATQSNPHRDWVTLPDRGALWAQPDEAAARMLVAYAKQYRPCATLFLGSDATTLRDMCAPLAPMTATFGEAISVTSAADSLETLFTTLDRVLPVSLLVSEASPTAEVGAQVQQHPCNAGVRLYWDGPPSRHTLEILRLVESTTPGNVAIQLGLRDLALNVKKSLPALWRLVAMKGSRATVSIVAEDGMARATGRTLTHVLARRQQARS